MKEEIWKPPQSRFNTRPLTSSKDASQTLGIFPIWKSGCTCVGSWLPSESGFCPERRGSHGYAQATNYLPFQLALKKIKFLSLSGSFCFAGGVLGWGALTRLPRDLLLGCRLATRSSHWRFRKRITATWCGCEGLFTQDQKSERWLYKCQTSGGVDKKNCTCVQSPKLLPLLGSQNTLHALLGTSSDSANLGKET